VRDDGVALACGGHKAGLCVQFVVEVGDHGHASQSVAGTERAGELVHPAGAAAGGERRGDCLGGLGDVEAFNLEVALGAEWELGEECNCQVGARPSVRGRWRVRGRGG
jgi:hypothetical protein